jgi:hypothetical protein
MIQWQTGQNKSQAVVDIAAGICVSTTQVPFAFWGHPAVKELIKVLRENPTLKMPTFHFCLLWRM